MLAFVFSQIANSKPYDVYDMTTVLLFKVIASHIIYVSNNIGYYLHNFFEKLNSNMTFSCLGGSVKNVKKDKRRKKEKEFEKRGDANLLSAYNVQNEHPSESKKGGATAKNSTGTPAGDSTNVNATVNAPIAKLSKLGLGTITAVENSSTSDALNSAEEGQHGAEMKPGNPEAEKPEEETCWENKTLADDTPENGNKATKFVVDDERTPTAASNGKSSSNGRKVYDRNFLLSNQKAAGSLKKAPFTEEPHFKDIVTHSPQFLQPLADNVPVNDFRDFSQSSHNYGNSSMGGSGNDFAPDYLRRQRPMVSDVYF